MTALPSHAPSPGAPSPDVPPPDARSGPLRVEPVDGRRLSPFIDVPRRLYRGWPGFVPPLRLERQESLSPDKNPYFRHAEVAYWMAWRGDRPVGRISAQVDRVWLERHGDSTGHFGLLAAEDDAEVFAALTGTAEAWLRARGMQRILGPFSLSINEEVGLLVDGFEATPMLMMPYDPPYAGPRLEALGYVKAKDVLAYDFDVDGPRHPNTDKMLARMHERSRVVIRTLDMKRYREDLALALDIFNDCWSDNWGFIPFGAAEMEHAAQSMKPLIDPKFSFLIEIDGESACMMVVLPNLTEAIRDLDGRLLPFGWAKLLWRLKTHRVRTARVLLLGLRRKFRRSLAGSAMLFALTEAIRVRSKELGIRRVEMSWILEDNTSMRHVLDGIGAVAYKTYRIYEKPLA